MKYLTFSLFSLFVISVVLVIFASQKGINLISLASPIKGDPVSGNTINEDAPFFYGMNVEMSQILPSSERYVINSVGRDLIDIASDLGINLFRITNQTRSFNNEMDAIYTKEQWNIVLNKMQSKGIRAIILIEANSNTADLYSRDIHPIYLELVKSYVLDSSVLSHPNVYAVDIKNEPIITQNNLNYLKQAALLIKEAYPDTKITVGWWGATGEDVNVDVGKDTDRIQWDNYVAGKELDSLIDFYSIHMYGFDKKKFGVYIDPVIKTKLFISQVKKALNTDKQILIGEFGAANGESISDQDTIGSPELQVITYKGVYQALADLRDVQLIGTAGFQLYGRGNNTDAWSIVKDKGDYLFPVAKVIKAYSTNQLASINNISEKIGSNEIILTENNRSKTTIFVGDKLGFKLKLNGESNYDIIFSKSNLLQLIEPLKYDKQSDRFYAAYKAAENGGVEAKVIIKSECKLDQQCNNDQIMNFEIEILKK